MIDWIKKLFGQGRVRVEWEGVDTAGVTRSGDAKAPYIGSWDEEAMKDYIADRLRYQYGVTVTKMQIVAHIEE